MIRPLVYTLVFLFLPVAAVYFYLLFSVERSSGSLHLDGVDQTVTINFDDHGVPDIQSASRSDSAFALGFLHAQHRLFQMDIMRRNSAGELSQLIGKKMLQHDRAVRVHRFRALAKQRVKELPEHYRAILKKYTLGVNAGIADLAVKPIEYLVLHSSPEEWQEEDSFLVMYSMYISQQDAQANYERSVSLLKEVFPKDVSRFLHPEGGEWDSPLDGGPIDNAALPTTSLADLSIDKTLINAIGELEVEVSRALGGSNNWAVSGRLTPHGGAMVADDMHLDHSVPNIWYRASWPVSQDRTVSGATLPGWPAMVVGSNGEVAWGFTNSFGDWADLVLVDEVPDGEYYQTPTGPRPYEIYRELIEVKGEEPVSLRVKNTIWGPVLGNDHRGRKLAMRWVAHDAEGANMNSLEFERVESVEAMLELRQSVGMPAQNLVCGDRQGNIAWTIAGPIPKRIGLSGKYAESWALGDKTWQGYLQEEHPYIYNPESGRLWTANSRVLSGDAWALLGNAGLKLGVRQKRIEMKLFEKEAFTESDFLALQLDDRNLLLDRWHRVALDSLAEIRDDDLPGKREDILNELGKWQGRANATSVSYRLVRNFRIQFANLALQPFVAKLKSVDPSFEYNAIKRPTEYPIWHLADKEPGHLLNPKFTSWGELKAAALKDALLAMGRDGSRLSEQRWGKQNSANIKHPLMSKLPILGRFYSMPKDELEGDIHVPRVQSPTGGASQRMVVSPGRESEALFSMPGGQSANLISPWFKKGHADWVAGKGGYLVPRNIVSTITLLPTP
ncbi:penicillin acylase family protein [Pseudoteredinibacter isoporae]|uniref:penicillin acylase family protein n=1 Tax=Pseudoteredinibacter isoporae TaxID=570281 RepID=UPI0031052D26